MANGLEHFLYAIARCTPDWTPANIVEESVGHPAAGRRQAHHLRALAGSTPPVAALVQRAVGSQLTCVFVDHGLLRKGEAEQVERDYVAATGVDLKVVDASAQFLSALSGVADPEEKRKIIGREFIRTFEAAAREVVGEAGEVEFLVQARSIPTWWNPVAVRARPTSRVITMSAACHTICSSNWWSRCARCSRTRWAVGAQLGLPPGSSGGIRSRPRAGDQDHRRGHQGAARRSGGGRDRSS